MTLGDYYRNRGNLLEPQQILTKVKNDVLNQLDKKTSIEDCKELQDFLNAAFYPEKYNKAKNFQEYNKKITQTIEMAYQKKYDVFLNNFTLGSSDVTYGKLKELIRNKHEAFEHKTRIYVQTIKTRLEQTYKAIENLNINNSTEEFMKIKGDLQKLQKLLEEALTFKADGYDKRGEYISFDKNKNIIDLIRQIDEIFRNLSGGVFSPQDYGQILEWTLQALSGESEKIIDQVGDDLTDELLEKLTNTAGSEKTSGNSNIYVKITAKNLGNNFIETKSTDTDSIEYTIKDSEGGEFSFKATKGFTPNRERQGKMDVNFLYKNNVGETIPFRISAKNWKNLNRDFGETNIAYALLRTIGNANTESYVFTLQDQSPSNFENVQIAHLIAMYSIILDILMGYSQENNYADTLVINIRDEQRVIVASIFEILNNINEDLDNLHIPDYNYQQIQNNLRTIMRSLQGSKKKSETYYAMSLKYLQSTKVRLRYASISRYINTPITV